MEGHTMAVSSVESSPDGRTGGFRKRRQDRAASGHWRNEAPPVARAPDRDRFGLTNGGQDGATA